jgi:hypothetical protein
MSQASQHKGRLATQQQQQQVLVQPKQKPKYVKNRLGSLQLIDEENYLYNKNKTCVQNGVGTKEYFVCTKNHSSPIFCKAKALVIKPTASDLYPEGTEFVTYYGEHTHYSNPIKAKANEMDRHVMNNAMTDTTTPPSRLLVESTSRFRKDHPEVNNLVMLSRRKPENLIRSIRRIRQIAKAKGHIELS